MSLLGHIELLLKSIFSRFDEPQINPIHLNCAGMVADVSEIFGHIKLIKISHY